MLSAVRALGKAEFKLANAKAQEAAPAPARVSAGPLPGTESQNKAHYGS